MLLIVLASLRESLAPACALAFGELTVLGLMVTEMKSSLWTARRHRGM